MTQSNSGVIVTSVSCLGEAFTAPQMAQIRHNYESVI